MYLSVALHDGVYEILQWVSTGRGGAGDEQLNEDA
jgi:hypothetical protein